MTAKCVKQLGYLDINTGLLNQFNHMYLMMQLLDHLKISSRVYAVYVYDSREMKQLRFQDHKQQFSEPNTNTPKT
jgi:hypothetical protein